MKMKKKFSQGKEVCAANATLQERGVIVKNYELLPETAP